MNRETETSAAPVVLPEPDLYVRPSIAAYELPWQVCNGSASAEPAYLAETVRALLATGGQAQAIAEKAAKYDHLLPYLCKTCGGYGLVDRRCHDDPLGSEPCPDCNAAPQAQADARDAALAQASEAMQLALSSHGVTLTSLPPQDAWMTRGVSGKLSAAIAAIAAAKGE